jgi:hypothetical protein
MLGYMLSWSSSTQRVVAHFRSLFMLWLICTARLMNVSFYASFSQGSHSPQSQLRSFVITTRLSDSLTMSGPRMLGTEGR